MSAQAITRRDFRIAQEPRGKQLEGLLSTALTYCDRFLLALSKMKLDQSGERILEELRPFQLSSVEASEYPAATLPSGRTVTVQTYRLTAKSAERLRRATDRLYCSVEPGLPNDLCLLRGDEPWLITMASDRVAILALDEAELEVLRRRLPDMRLVAMD
jgi:hypothetical protein